MAVPHTLHAGNFQSAIGVPIAGAATKPVIAPPLVAPLAVLQTAGPITSLQSLVSNLGLTPETGDWKSRSIPASRAGEPDAMTSKFRTNQTCVTLALRPSLPPQPRRKGLSPTARWPTPSAWTWPPTSLPAWTWRFWHR